MSTVFTLVGKEFIGFRAGVSRCVPLLVALVVGGFSQRALAQATLASDNASNAPYSGGTFVGLDGGFGFQAWTANPVGGGGSYVGGTGLSGASFGVYAGGAGGNAFTAYRKFDNPLGLGEKFSVTFRPTSIDNGGSVGVSMFSSGVERGTMYFNGGASNWGWNAGAGGSNTNLVFSGAVELDITRIGTNTYTLDLLQGVTSQTISGTFTAAGNPVSSDINEVGFFSFQQGAGQNFGFNNLEIVPEPSTYVMAVCGAALCGLHGLRRRRSRT